MKIKLLPISCLIIFILLFNPAFAQSGSGYWKLADVKHHTARESVSNIISDFNFTSDGGSGGVNFKVKAKRYGSPFEIVGRSTWAAPPSKAIRGITWNTNGSGSISKNPGGYKCFANPLFSSDNGSFSPDRTTFTFPGGVPGQKMKIGVKARILCRMPYFLISDSYVYTYEWTQGAIQSKDAHLRIEAKSSFGGPIKDMVFIVEETMSGRSWKLKTNDSGMAMKKFTLLKQGSPYTLVISALYITPDTKFADSYQNYTPSFLYKKSIKIKLNRKVVLSPANNYIGKTKITIPVFQLTVKPKRSELSPDKRKYIWVSCPANVKVRKTTSTELYHVAPNLLTKVNNAYQVRMIIPTREILATNKLYVYGYDSKTRFKDIASFKPPDHKSRNKKYTAILKLTGVLYKISVIKKKLYKYFLPIVGKSRALEIASVKFILENDRSKPRYLDNKIYISEDVDLTTDENSESLMHEWSHHIVKVLMDDPYMDSATQVSSKGHDTWTKSPNEEIAWDEGRAHFFSVLLTRGLRLPYNPITFEKNYAKAESRKNDGSGNLVEGVITASLFDYYTGLGHKKTTQTVKNIIEISDFCKKTKGHYPRTSDEYYDTLSNYYKTLEKQGSISPEKARKMEAHITKTRNEWRVYWK